MHKAVPILAILLLAPGCQQTPEPPRVTAENAVVTLPAVPGRPGAAYFTLRTNREGTRLTAITSPRIGRFELHETVAEGGASRMQRLQDSGFSPDSPLEFAPGGRHAMMFEIDPSLRVGDRIPLAFEVPPAPPVIVEAEVRAPGDAGHSGH